MIHEFYEFLPKNNFLIYLFFIIFSRQIWVDDFSKKKKFSQNIYVRQFKGYIRAIKVFKLNNSLNKLQCLINYIIFCREFISYKNLIFS